MLALWSGSALAGTTWDGGAGPDDWSQANNWAPNGVPAANANITIGTGGNIAIVNSNRTINSLTFNRAANFLVSNSGGGILTINGGGINFTAAGNDLTISAPINLGANQTWTVNTAGRTLTVSGTINLNGFRLTIAGAGNTTISGVISGTGGITKNGTGTLTLSNAANTYTGQTIINQGTVSVPALADGGVNSSLGATVAGTPILLGSATAATLSYTGGTTTMDRTITINGAGGGTIETTAAGTLTLTGNIANSGDPLTFDVNAGNITSTGVISGAGSLTKAGAGTLTLSGGAANTFTGTTTVNAGTLELSRTAANGSILGPLVVGDGAGTDTVLVTTADQIPDGSTVTTNGGDLTFNANLSETIGTLSMTGGSVNASGTGVITLTSDVTTNAFATSAVISGILELNAANRTFNVANGAAARDLDVTAQILGPGETITKTGAGTMTLSGAVANTFDGTVTVNGGTLELNKTVADGSILGPLVINTGATTLVSQPNQISSLPAISINNGALTLNTNLSETIGASVTMTGGSINSSGTGVITLGADLQLVASANTATISGILDLNSPNRLFTVPNGAAARDLDITAQVIGPGDGFTKDGDGLMDLSGAVANTYNGTTRVISGTLELSKTAANGAIIGPLVIGDGAGAGTDTVLLTANNQIADGVTITMDTAALTLAAGISDTVGPLNMTASATATSGGGTLTLNGDVTTNVSATSSTMSGQIALAANRTFNVADGAAAQDLLVTANISGAGQLIKSELGTMVLTGANTMNGFLLNLGVLESQSATGLSAGNSTIAGGTLRISTVNQTYNQVLNFIGGSNIDVVAGRTLNFGNGANDVTGTALITKIGGGTLVLDQASNHSGGYTLTAGQITMSNNTALGTGQLTMNGGTLFTIGATLTVPNPLYVLSDSTINSNNGDDIEFSSNSISGLPGMTLNYVSTGAGATAHSLMFSGSGFDLASNINLDGFSRVRFENTTGVQTFSGNFLGTGYTADGGTLVRGYTNGAVGTTRLLGTSTFTGPVSVQAGTLSIGSNAPSGAAGALGSAVSAIVVGDNNGTDPTALVIEGPFTIGRNITVQAGSTGASTLGGTNLSGTSTFSGTVTLSKNLTLTAAIGGTTDFTGVISSAGGVARALTKTGAGTVVLSAANTAPASGSMTINAGTLLVNGSILMPTTVTTGLLGGSGTVSNTVAVGANGGFTPGATGPGSTGTLSTNAVTLAGTSALNFDLDTPAARDRVAITGNLTLDGVFTVTPFSGFGAGTYTVMTYTGALTNNTATVNAIPGYTITVDTSVAGQVNLVVAALATASIWDGGGVDNLWTTAANWNGNVLPAFPGAPPGTANLFFGSGFASGDPALNGAKNINSLNINSATLFTIFNDTINIATGDIKRFNVGGVENIHTIASNIAMGGNGAWFIDGSNYLDVSGALSGAFTLTKTGFSELRLSGPFNPYTGVTTVSQGTLSVAADGALGTTAGNTVVSLDATLGFIGGINYTTLEGLNISGVGQGGVGAINNMSGDNTFAGNIAMAANSSLGSAVVGDELTLSGVLSGGFAMTKVGVGSVLLSNANTYTGLTTINAGTLAVSANNALGTTAGGVLILNGGTLRLDAVNYASAEAVAISGMGDGNVGAIYGSTGNSTFGGAVALNVASGIGANTGARVTLTNAVSGGYQLSKLGAGTLELTSNANIYFGGTAITAGTLLANNTNLAASATGTGPVSVQNGGTLAGTGSISGPITVLNGGTISPGDNTTESLDVTAVALATGGTYSVQINSNVAVTGYDQLNVAGPLNLNTDAGAGSSVLVNMGYSPVVTDFFTIINKTSAGPISGTFAGLPEGATFLSATDAFIISYVDGDGNDVVIRPVPRVRNVTSAIANGTYGVGTDIDITIEWSLPVVVSGTPQLTLETGAVDKVANYISTAGNITTFRYTVASPDVSADLDYVSTSALALNGGTIQSIGTLRNAILTLASPGTATSLGANKAIVIDTARPVVANVTSPTANGTYTTGATIDVTVQFNEVVVVTGTPQLTLETGSTVADAVADYLSGSGTNTLTFRFTVVAGMSTPDLDYVATNSLALNGGTIVDLSNPANTAILTLPSPGAAGSLGFNKAIVIDAPAVVATARETVDADGDGRIDAIRIVTDVNLNDNFTGLAITVAGFVLAGAPYDTGGTANDSEFFVRLVEAALPPDTGDTNATPTVTITASGSLGLQTGAGVAATDKAKPVLLASQWNNVGSGDGVDAGDTVTLTFSEPVTTVGALIADIGLPVTNDTFATSSIANQGPATTIDITLAGAMRLTPAGTYSVAALTAGSPTGVFIADGTRFRDSAAVFNTALNQGFGTAVDLRPGGRIIAIVWADTHTFERRAWDVDSDADYGAAYKASGAAAPPILRVTNAGNGRQRFDMFCMISEPSGWTIGAAAGINIFEMKVDPAPPSAFSLDLATGPKQLAAQLYSGHESSFDLQLVTPTEITTGADVEQHITVTIVATQD